VTRLKWKLVSVHLKIVLNYLSWFKIGARLAPNIPFAQKSFWTHPMELLGDVGHVRLEVVLVSVQDGSTVCTKCSIASEIVLDTPNGAPR
jgi:hypothetical protein